VEVVPGEREMLSLARNALAVVSGERAALVYGAGGPETAR
jgi:butyrate kinase